MNAVLWGKYRKFIRKPGGFIITSMICAVFAFLVGSSSFTKVEIPIFSTDTTEQIDNILLDLNKSDSYTFVRYTEKEITEKIEEGVSDVGIALSEDSYTLYRVTETENVITVNRYLEKYYQNKQQQKAIMELASDKKEAENILKENEKNPILPIHFDNSLSEEEATYSQSLQALFGFTLFFSIYTVAYTVVEILREKQSGIWDRFILSSVSKTKLFLGHLFFSFSIGYMQIILIFIIFKFGAGVDFNGNFYKVFLLIIPYLYSIVALAILLTGIVKTASQFNSIIPLVSVSFAMLGGAYWPLEIVTSKFLLLLSKVIPITYGMELLKLGISEDALWSELLLPISILLLMGTLMLGIGIRLIERRHV